MQMLDPRPDYVMVAGGLLLASANSSNQKQPVGLLAYGPDRKLKFKMFRHNTVAVAAVLSGRAWVYVYASTLKVAVVDLASHRVIGLRRGELPTPLLSDGPDW
jgi:hypothetical protein